jgi:hypothetical protein
VFFHSGSDGQNIRIENDILRWQKNFLCQNFICTGTDFLSAFKIVGLPFFVGLALFAAGGVIAGREVFVHLDVDVLDPSVMPGLAYPAPGGSSPRSDRCGTN